MYSLLNNYLSYFERHAENKYDLSTNKYKYNNILYNQCSILNVAQWNLEQTDTRVLQYLVTFDQNAWSQSISVS